MTKTKKILLYLLCVVIGICIGNLTIGYFKESKKNIVIKTYYVNEMPDKGKFPYYKCEALKVGDIFYVKATPNTTCIIE